MKGDPRESREWRKLRDRVVLEEPECRLRLPGCTVTSQTADHIVPVSHNLELALERSNHRGACHHCNRKRQNKSDYEIGIERRERPRALDIFLSKGR